MSSLIRRVSGARLERIKASKQFSEGAFRNTASIQQGLKSGTKLKTVGQWVFGRERRIPIAPLPTENPRDHWLKASDSGLRVTWLGHSTLLVELGGVRVLTDPVWAERASPTMIAGPRRFQSVPVTIDKLPPLDAIVISHDHYDHLDHRAVLELGKLGVPFFVPLGVGARLEEWGVRAELIHELDWWESVDLRKNGVMLHAAPAQHFSGRSVGDRNHTLWCSFVIKSDQHSFFFSGDTGLTPEYGEIRERFGPFDLATLEVGAFHPNWGDIHLGPANALAALELLGTKRILPIHWGTFNLGMHDWDEPAEQLVALAPKRDIELIMPKIGMPFEPSHEPRLTPWWREIAALELKPGAKAELEEKAAEADQNWEPID